MDNINEYGLYTMEPLIFINYDPMGTDRFIYYIDYQWLVNRSLPRTDFQDIKNVLGQGLSLDHLAWYR